MKKNNFSVTDLVFSVWVGIIVFFLTFFFSDYYLYGDQFYYRDFYSLAGNLDFSEVVILAYSKLGSIEPVYPFLVWVFSGLVSKAVFVSFSNAILAVFALRLGKLVGGSPVVVSLVLLSNFYFYVLFFSAERLKYGFILFFLGLIFWDGEKVKKSFASMSFSVLAHAQMLIMLLGNVLNTVIDNRRKIFNIRFVPIFFVLGVLAAGMFAYLLSHLIGKFSAYSDRAFDLSGLVKIALFSSITLWYAKFSRHALLQLLPLVLASAVLGGERIVMLVYFLFMYYSLGVCRGFNLGVFFVNLYFFIKTIYFVRNVIVHGNAFYE